MSASHIVASAYVRRQVCQRASGLSVPTSYNAFGDSITAGYSLASPSQAYPTLVASSLGVGVSNDAISGDEACDIFPRQIYPNGVQPQQNTAALYTVQIGTNDADIKGSGGYEATFRNCHLAVLAWLAIPRDFMVMPGDAALVGSGSWSAAADTTTPALQGPALDSTGAGTLAATLTTYGGAIYVFYTLNDQFPTYYFTVSIDGGAASVPYYTGMSVPMSTANGTTISRGVARIPVPAGRHTVTASTTTGAVAIYGIGTIPPEKHFGSVVLSGDAPNQCSGACTPLASPATVAAYNADILADEALLISDGADIRHVPDQKYMLATPSELNDAVHPNVLGQQHLATAYEQALKPRF